MAQTKEQKAAYNKQWRAKNSKRIKTWRAENRDQQSILNAERHKRKRATVLFHYGNKCACCGENRPEFLTIDHINNDGAAHRREVGRTGLYHWIIKNGFPDFLQILCMNCNCAKEWYGRCPHEDM